MSLPDRIWATDHAFWEAEEINDGTPYLRLDGPTLTAVREAMTALVDEYCDYMRINHLGDPEAQHNIKRCRAAVKLLDGE